MHERMPRRLVRAALNYGALGALLLLVAAAPAMARPAAKQPTMSESKGHAAISRFAASVGNNTGADSTLVDGCIRHTRSAIDCTVLYYYDDLGGAPCQAKAQAYYVGKRIAVRPLGGIDCSGQDLAPNLDT